MDERARFYAAPVFVYCLQRGIKIRQRYFGEETQRAEIHAQDGDAGLSDHSGRRKQGAIPAHHDDKVQGTRGDFLPVHHLWATYVDRCLGVNNNLVMVFIQPCQQLGKNASQLGLGWLRHNGCRLT